MAAAELRVGTESWPIAGGFAISRGSKTSADVVVVELIEDAARGRGECVPYARYGESLDQVVAAIDSLRADFLAGRLNRPFLLRALPPGAARNAVDCALWDLETRRTGVRAGELAGLGPLAPLTTAYTLSLDSPEKMGRAAAAQERRPLLKIKLGGEGDLERVAAIRQAAPAARLIVDANEGWTASQVESLAAQLGKLGVCLVEQPLPAGADGLLAELDHAVPFCADESCHTVDDVGQLADRYEYVNIKLDKTGGLTAALALKKAAVANGLGIMVGCMVGTSLAMAPAVLLAQDAEFVDLDGPLLLERDRIPGLVYDGSRVLPPDPELWG